MQKGNIGMDKQDITIKRLNQYIKDNGVTAVHICEIVDIPQYVVSRFRHHKQLLDDESLENLDNYLKQHNY